MSTVGALLAPCLRRRALHPRAHLDVTCAREGEPPVRTEASARDRADHRAGEVISHLHTLLNTRCGSSLSHPTYGLPDLTELLHAVPSSLPALQRAIAEAVAGHEPRLRDVVVRSGTPDASRLRLPFAVSALLPDGRSLSCTVTLALGGRVLVTSGCAAERVRSGPAAHPRGPTCA